MTILSFHRFGIAARILLGSVLLTTVSGLVSAQTSSGGADKAGDSNAKPEVSKSDADPAAETEKPKAQDDAVKEPARVYKTDAEWRRLLTHDQYLVTRLKATEPAFSGRYATGHFKGTFLCVCCGAKLFDSRTKFDSGTGWPSFWRPLEVRAIEEALDRSEAVPRVEVMCARCGAHLGHVFSDGPPPTGLRYCINSLAIKLDSEPARPASSTKRSTNRRRTTTTRDARPEAPESSSPPADR